MPASTPVSTTRRRKTAAVAKKAATVRSPGARSGKTVRVTSKAKEPEGYKLPVQLPPNVQQPELDFAVEASAALAPAKITRPRRTAKDLLDAEFSTTRGKAVNVPRQARSRSFAAPNDLDEGDLEDSAATGAASGNAPRSGVTRKDTVFVSKRPAPPKPMEKAPARSRFVLSPAPVPKSPVEELPADPIIQEEPQREEEEEIYAAAPAPARPIPRFRPLITTRRVPVQEEEPVEDADAVDPDELALLREEFLDGRKQTLNEIRTTVSEVDEHCRGLDEKIQLLREVRNELKEQFDTVNELNPKYWAPNRVIEEMSAALSTIGKAQRSHQLLQGRVDEITLPPQPQYTPHAALSPLEAASLPGEEDAETLAQSSQDYVHEEDRPWWNLASAMKRVPGYAESAEDSNAAVERQFGWPQLKFMLLSGLAFAIPLLIIAGFVLWLRA